MRNPGAAVLAALFLILAILPARSDDVTLTSRDGEVEITGTLLGYDGEFYRVDTRFGILTVDGSGVNCEGPACPNLGAYVAEFTLSGAQSMGEVLVPSLVEGFALYSGYALGREDLAGIGTLYTLYDSSGAQPAARITIRLTSSDEGFADLLGEETDMVLSLREVTAVERSLAQDAGLGDLAGARQSRVIALDALVPVVSGGNPVRRMSMQDLRSVFSGQITRWSELGGEDAPITIYARDPEYGLGRAFAGLALADASLAPRAVRLSTDRAIADAVARDPFGIGITGFERRGMSEIVTLSGSCGFEVVASRGAAKAGDYPLTVPMYLYLPARRLPKLARDFLGYLRSDSAQLVIRRAGFVDQALDEVPIDVQGQRLANAIRAAGDEIGLDELQRMVALMSQTERLTLTFRFRGGSAALDAPSRSNVTLLASALEAGRFDGRSISFVGFSDGKGDAGQNLRLARRRAEAVRDAVLAETEAFDRQAVTISADAFGEALPMACDDTAWGRHVNRRVEIWVK